jgi:hypothetical protein
MQGYASQPEEEAMEFIWFVVIAGVLGLVFGGIKGLRIGVGLGLIGLALFFGYIWNASVQEDHKYAQKQSHLKSLPKCSTQAEDTDSYWVANPTCHGYEEPVPNEEPVPRATKPAPAPKHYAWSVEDNDLTAEYCDQGIHVGAVKAGERVEILLANTCGAKVKTKDGTVGWLYPGKSITTVAPKVKP